MILRSVSGLSHVIVLLINSKKQKTRVSKRDTKNHFSLRVLCFSLFVSFRAVKVDHWCKITGIFLSFGIRAWSVFRS
jgi:hypothetical protein